MKVKKYLDKNYPKEEKEKIVELDISRKNLTGPLKMEEFANLTRLICSDNSITKIDLSDLNIEK